MMNAYFQKYIMVDQFGYRPGDDKVAVLADPQIGFNADDSYVPGETLQVRKVDDDSIVFTGVIKAWNKGEIQASSGDRGWWLDFSPVSDEGYYYIYDEKNHCKSCNFRIADNVYNEVLKAAIRVFYYQRLGTPHLTEHAGEAYADKAALLGPGQDTEARCIFDPDNPATAKDLQGGWADAGDLNKYVTFTESTLNELLTAYETNPDVFGDDYNIPESGNGIPDIIDEIKWELDWMKKMQEPDGGVLLKVGFARDLGDEMEITPPSANRQKRYYYPACSSSTISVAFVFSHAALVFKRFPSLQSYADDLRERAEIAWKWYHSHPKVDNMDNGEIRAGDADRSLEVQEGNAVSAAVYLWALTGDESYHRYFKQNYRKTAQFNNTYWGIYNDEQGDALLYYTTLWDADRVIKADILNWRNKSDTDYALAEKQDLYRSYLPDWMYFWGSNMERARYGATAYDFSQYDIDCSKADEYKKRAINTLHYFHGVNPFSTVYLTNMESLGATNSFKKAYHVWFAPGSKWETPPPGYLPGGPNSKYTGTTSPPKGQPIQKSYFDFNWVTLNDPNQVDISWEITEPAIYYQAAYIKLVSRFVAPVAKHPGNSVPTLSTPAVSITGKVEADKVTRYTSYSIQSPISSTVAEKLKNIHEEGSRLGRNPRVFMKVGDSITVNLNFMGSFTNPDYVEGGEQKGTRNLGEYTILREVLEYYLSQEVKDITIENHDKIDMTMEHYLSEKVEGRQITSFNRGSKAAEVGQTGEWAISRIPSPLQKEIDDLNPSVAIIKYGANDLGMYEDDYATFNWYAGNIILLVDKCICQGILPILSSVSPRGGTNRNYIERAFIISHITRCIAQGRMIPHINLYKAMLPLKDMGLREDGVHPNVMESGSGAWLTREGLEFGHNMRNLVTLTALDRVYQVCEKGAVSLNPPTTGYTGTGTLSDPVVVDEPEFIDFRRVSPAVPTFCYRLKLQKKSRVRIFVTFQGDMDMTIKVTHRGNNELCKSRGLLDCLLEPGIYNIRLDARIHNTLVYNGEAGRNEYQLLIYEVNAD